MKSNLFIFLMLINFSFQSSAQTSIFKVLCQSGTNFVNNKPLLTGATLFPNDELIIGKNSFVGLLHKSGKTIEIKKEGSYDTKILGLRIPATNTTVYKKYLEFVNDELAKNETKIEKKGHEKEMNTSGSVYRDVNKLQLCLPDTTPEIDIVSKFLTINWKSNKNKTTYIIHIMDEEEEDLKTLTTSDSSITLDISKIPLGTENEFYIKIHENEKKDKQFTQQRKIVFHKSCSLNESLEQINKNLSEETSVNYYLKGHFYEEHQFFPEALNAYKKAYNMNKHVKIYKERLNNLLIKNKLSNFVID